MYLLLTINYTNTNSPKMEGIIMGVSHDNDPPLFTQGEQQTSL